MNALLLLMALLVLSYIGSFVVGGRAIRGYGLPSGAEYLALGFVMGPYMLDVVERSMLEAFEPVALVGVSWLALVVGLDYGYIGRERVSTRRLLLGTGVSLGSFAIVASVCWAFLRYFVDLGSIERTLIAGGIAAGCSETTRHAIRWVVERHQARGPLSTLIAEIADGDDLVPLISTAVLFSLAPTRQVVWALPLPYWVAITLAMGAVLGAIATVLLGREFRLDESWGVLLGMSLLGIGMAARLNVSPLATMFALGLTISALSRHGHEVRAMVAPTEKAVLLPVLMLAGAHIDLHATPRLPWIIAVTLGARILAKVAAGSLLGVMVPKPHPGPLLGVAMLSSGALATSVGLAMAFRYPGPVGDTVLAAAAAATVFGEFVGPASLRRVLQRAGEVSDARSSLRPPPAGGAP